MSYLLPAGTLLALFLTVACGGEHKSRTIDKDVLAEWQMTVAEEEGTEVPGAIDEPKPQKNVPVKSGGVDVTKSPELVCSPYTPHYSTVYNAPLREIFNDSNKYQYAYAERLGIRPIHHIGQAYFTTRPIVKIEACDAYGLDTLTHSMPYLVPEAQNLLAEIGKRFTKKAKIKTGGDYKIKVTSLLRSPASVKRLRHVNRNATDSSTHQFATTFDISYTSFFDKRTGEATDVRGLREALAETIFELRKENRCLVKYEVKSPCYHITVAR